ncbi:MAG: dTDP-4-amino-4,6-dideoxygalactose transaminase [Salinivenus sp.]
MVEISSLTPPYARIMSDQATSSVSFNEPVLGEAEAEAVRKVLGSGTIRGDGPVSQHVEEEMEEWLGIDHVFLTTSCTHALEMAMVVLDIGPGDEVIMPSFNFVSSANAVVLRGATPVFAEIEPDTLNLDVEAVRKKINPRTKAIVPVHYAGVSCDMGALLALADEHDLYVVEDAAQGVDAYYDGQALGTMGDIGCYSFHETKNITCGEGGAFLTNDEQLARKAELVREKGTNRSAFIRGEVDKYTWVSEGSSYILSDILASVLRAQLRRRSAIKRKRKAVWTAYHEALAPLAEEGIVTLPTIPARCTSNYHIFFFRVGTPRQRNHLLDVLKNHGIDASFHYIPLHSSPYGQEYLGDEDTLPRTKHCSETLIRLPLHPGLAEDAASLADRVAHLLVEESA